MNIAFINPPFLPKYSRGSRSPAVTKSGTVYYPIWLALAAGYAEQKGHEIILIDAPAEVITLEETIERLKSFKPDLAVVETSTGSITHDIDFTAQLKISFPSIINCLVGNHVTALHNEVLTQYPITDCVARNEYEETIVELADADVERKQKAIECYKSQYPQGLLDNFAVKRAKNYGKIAGIKYAEAYNQGLCLPKGAWKGTPEFLKRIKEESK